jgi:hypothetical protein
MACHACFGSCRVCHGEDNPECSQSGDRLHGQRQLAGGTNDRPPTSDIRAVNHQTTGPNKVIQHYRSRADLGGGHPKGRFLPRRNCANRGPADVADGSSAQCCRLCPQSVSYQ